MNQFTFLFIFIVNTIIVYLFSLQYFDHPASFTLDPIYSAKKTSTVVSKCPKIIHQIVPDINNVPSGLYNTIKHHIHVNPEFEYRIYDYKSAEEILKKDFEPNILTAYNSSNLNQIKSDYIKLAFIFKYGGIFIDISQIMCIKLIDLLKVNNVYYVHNLTTDTMDLKLLISHPENIAILNTFNRATDQLIYKMYGDDHIDITSGRVLGEELFNLGYLMNFSLVFLDKDNIVKSRIHKKLICNNYKSFERENNIFNLLPDIEPFWKEKLIFE
jgi:hypothetical protein